MTRDEMLAAYAAGRRDFRRVDLTDANLICADLRRVDLSRAILSGADLREADLREGILSRSILSGADLSRADLRRADLSGADLRKTILNKAFLSGTDLREAAGVDWVSCGWTHHGERGRMLLGVIIDGEPRYFCGCFSGTESEILEYIASGSQELARSRMVAIEFVAARLAEMRWRR